MVDIHLNAVFDAIANVMHVVHTEFKLPVIYPGSLIIQLFA